MPRARGTTLQPRVQVTRSSVPPQAYAQLSSGTNSSYSYDSDGMRLRTFEGSVWSTMVWDQGDYLAVNRSGADDSLFVLMDGEALGEVRGGTLRDFMADPLGSVRGHLTSSAISASFDYWPYGESVLPVESTDGPLLWLGTMGYYSDPGARSYVRARVLDRKLASWLQVDPLWPREPGFGYVGGMPVMAVDPSGLMCAKPKLCRDLILPGPGSDKIIDGARECTMKCARKKNPDICFIGCMIEMGLQGQTQPAAACCLLVSRTGGSFGWNPCENGVKYDQRKCCHMQFCICAMSTGDWGDQIKTGRWDYIFVLCAKSASEACGDVNYTGPGE